MSTGNLDSSDKNNSSKTLVFPAGRRNVQRYNSRILSDDNFRRTYTSMIKTTGEDSRGNLILGYQMDQNNKPEWISFLMGGYYVYLSDNSTDSTLKAIRAKVGASGGLLCVWLWQDLVYPTSGGNIVTNYKEFECEDDGNTFKGLYHGTTIPEGAIGIRLVVPKDGIGTLDPTIDTTEEGDYYKPWFRSTAAWAASEYSNKNKIWVDDKYDVPHICIKQAGQRVWLPLGAVYKTANYSSDPSY